MSIIYALVGRGDKIFAEYTSFSGNFALTATQVLKACDGRKYLKYAANNYIFYVLNAECTFLVMCEMAYSERIAYNFLEMVRKMFVGSFSEEKIETAKMYDMMEFSAVLRTQIELYNKPEQVDKVANLMKHTQEVSKIIEEDLQKLLARGQKIDILVRKTETMASLSLEMKNSSRTIRNDMVWKNWKMRILIALVVMGLVYFLLVLTCGGFTLSGCF